MVKTRSQKAKEQRKMDAKNTKYSKGGNDGNGNNGNSDDEIDEVEFREILASLFPSNFANKQVEAAKKRKRKYSKKNSGKPNKVSKQIDDSDASSRASYEAGDDSDSSDISDSINSSDNGDSSDDSKEVQDKSNTRVWRIVNGKPKASNTKSKSNKNNNISCIITSIQPIHSKNDEDEEDDYEEDEDYNPEEDSNYEDESEDIGESEEDEDYEEEDEEGGEPAPHAESDEEEEDEDEDGDDKSEVDTPTKKSTSTAKTTPKDDKLPKIELDDMENGFQSKLAPVPKQFKKRCHNIWVDFKKKLENERRSFIVQSQKKQKKVRRDNLTSFRKMLKEGDVMNDLRYFNRIMSVEEQRRALEEMEKVKAYSHVDKPYRLRLLDAPIPPKIKAVALKKINTLRYTSPGDGEYNKLKKWVDAFLQIPFGKFSELELKLSDGREKCHEFMENAKQVLDDAVYGLDDVKLQVMQMLGQWISNPEAVGSAMAIHGPMGTGKTTLVKDGISKILGREFIFIALGGATDSSFLEGHSYTYEGSTWGKIVDLLMQCRTMNPIIYFDELDKVSDTPRGEEIIGILTHLTDTSQNDKFHDKYFSEIDFDLSRCMFFFSYNDPERVNPILRDRMYTIKTNGYSSAEKVTIAEKHLVPKILPQVGFTSDEITVPKETLEYITKEFSKEDEKGVRSLKRRIEIIFTKLNLYRLLKPGTTMFGQKIPELVSFPMTITPELVKELLNKEEKINNNHWVMYN
jgi:ATP-dependent Lon protease